MSALTRLQAFEPAWHEVLQLASHATATPDYRTQPSEWQGLELHIKGLLHEPVLVV
jgi:hypothetical protein